MDHLLSKEKDVQRCSEIVERIILK